MTDSRNKDSFPIYLDYNATTPLDPVVIEEIHRSLREDWGNPSSAHPFGEKAKTVIEQSRAAVARMLNAAPEDIVFMSGGTEANNIALRSGIQTASGASKGQDFKPHVITSNVEHDSVRCVLQELVALGSIDLSIVKVESDGTLLPEKVLSEVTPTTCLISVMHANNETGVVMPVDEIGRKLQSLNESRVESKEPQVLLHCDAAQSIGKIEVDVEKLHVDLLTVVGHKFYGPRIGALYVKNLLKPSTRYKCSFQGGGQERGFRPGTENTPMIAGLGKAAELVYANLITYQKRMLDIKKLLQKTLQDNISGLKINFYPPPGESLPNTLSVCLPDGIEAGSLLNVKCKGQLCASLGAACHSNTDKPSDILLSSGLSVTEARRTLRISVGRTTTIEEINCAAKILQEACQSNC